MAAARSWAPVHPDLHQALAGSGQELGSPERAWQEPSSGSRLAARGGQPHPAAPSGPALTQQRWSKPQPEGLRARAPPTLTAQPAHASRLLWNHSVEPGPRSLVPPLGPQQSQASASSCLVPSQQLFLSSGEQTAGWPPQPGRCSVMRAGGRCPQP